MLDEITEYFDTHLKTLTLEKFTQVALALLVCIILQKLLKKYSDEAADRMHLERTIGSFLRSCLRVVIYIFTALIVMDALGIPINSLIAVVSVAGLAISLSVQNVLANFVGGLLILITKPFQSGDYIETDTASGFVKEIGLIYTKLSTVEEKMVMIPNSILSSGKLVNRTLDGAQAMEATIGVSYSSDIDEVKRVLLQAVSKSPLVLEKPKPILYVSGYGDNAVEFTMLLHCDPKNAVALHHQMYELIGKALKKANIQIPFPQRDIHVIDSCMTQKNADESRETA